MSNTSPISNLAIIGRLNLLRSQFVEVFIPEAVRAELEHMPNPAAKALVEGALQLSWLQVSSCGKTLARRRAGE